VPKVHNKPIKTPRKGSNKESKRQPKGSPGLAHRTVSGGAPDYPVRHTTAASTNDHFGGWGYKYPSTTTLQCIQVFSHQTSYKSYRLH
jgi:hypothetical protein